MCTRTQTQHGFSFQICIVGQKKRKREVFNSTKLCKVFLHSAPTHIFSNPQVLAVNTLGKLTAVSFPQPFFDWGRSLVFFRFLHLCHLLNDERCYEISHNIALRPTNRLPFRNSEICQVYRKFFSEKDKLQQTSFKKKTLLWAQKFLGPCFGELRTDSQLRQAWPVQLVLPT